MGFTPKNRDKCNVKNYNRYVEKEKKGVLKTEDEKPYIWNIPYCHFVRVSFYILAIGIVGRILLLYGSISNA